MEASHGGASVHQANLLLSANVFAHLDEQVRLKPATKQGAPELVWHVIDHDDCRDRRFRQARLPALNGSKHPQSISIPVPSNLTMAAVGLGREVKNLLIDELRGYTEANLGRLLDLAAWFGSDRTEISVRASLGVICDAISSSQAADVVGLNIEFVSLLAGEWLGRVVKVVRSTQLYRSHQGLVRDMLREVQEAALSSPSDLAAGQDFPLRWDWWILRTGGQRERSNPAAGGIRRGFVGGAQILCGRDPAVLDEIGADGMVVPGVLADTVADLRIRKLAYATQYWRSNATIITADAISMGLWGRSPQSYFIGAPESFVIPAGQPPSWLSALELEGLASGIYSVVLYWLLGLTAAPPRIEAGAPLAGPCAA